MYILQGIGLCDCEIWLSKSKIATLPQAVWKGRSYPVGQEPTAQAEAVVHRQSKSKTLNRTSWAWSEAVVHR